MFEGRDIQIHCREIIEHHSCGRAALKFSKSFDIAETTFARLDHRVRTAFLRHEGNQLVMIGHAAVGAKQTLSLPLSATPAAAEIAAPLDASHFRKCRPGTADRTISFHPTYGFSVQRRLQACNTGTGRRAATAWNASESAPKSAAISLRRSLSWHKEALNKFRKSKSAFSAGSKVAISRVPLRWAVRISFSNKRRTERLSKTKLMPARSGTLLCCASVRTGTNVSHSGLVGFAQDFLNHGEPRLPLRVLALKVLQASIDRRHWRLSWSA